MKTKHNKNILYVACYTFGISTYHAGVDCNPFLKRAQSYFLTNYRYYAMDFNKHVAVIVDDFNRYQNYDLFFTDIAMFCALRHAPEQLSDASSAFAQVIIRNHANKNQYYAGTDSFFKKIGRLTALFPPADLSLTYCLFYDAILADCWRHRIDRASRLANTERLNALFPGQN